MDTSVDRNSNSKATYTDKGRKEPKTNSTKTQKQTNRNKTRTRRAPRVGVGRGEKRRSSSSKRTALAAKVSTTTTQTLVKLTTHQGRTALPSASREKSDVPIRETSARCNTKDRQREASPHHSYCEAPPLVCLSHLSLPFDTNANNGCHRVVCIISSAARHCNPIAPQEEKRRC